MSAPHRQHRYVAIADEIRRSIHRGAYDPDGRLPSERRLVRAFSAQRNTVRQALGLLEREGSVESVVKSGWFVTSGAGRSAVDTEPTVGKRVLLVTFREGETPSTDTIARGLGEVLDPRGLRVLRYDSAARPESPHAAAVDELIELDPGGLVLWPHGPIESSLLTRLQDEMPVVVVDRRVFGFESDSVRFDDLAGGRLVTDHLLAGGHRRIAFLGDEPFVESVQSRWTGYRQALLAAGIVPDDNLTLLLHGSHEPAFSATLRFLLRELPETPSAIVCSNDGVASRLLLYLRDEGMRVPDDVAVTGFGNEAPGYLDLMGLTTVGQSFAELGRVAGSLLVERLAERSPGARRARHEILLPMSLVVRGSSGPARPR